MNGININVGVNNSGFNSGLNAMRRGVASFKASLGSMFAGAAIGGGLVAGALGAAMALKKLASDAIDHADKVQDLSDRYGVATKTIQEWGFAASQNGSSMDEMTAAWGRLNVARARALGGDDAAIAKFKALGVSIEDLKNSAPDQTMMLIARSSMNAAAMTDLLGKSAQNLVPTLSALADGSAKLGKSMDDHTVRTLAKVKDGMAEWGQAAVTHLGGALVWVLDKLQESAKGWELMGRAAMSALSGMATTAKGLLTLDSDKMAEGVMGFAVELEALKKEGQRWQLEHERKKAERGRVASPRAIEEDDGDEKQKAEKLAEKLAKIQEAEADAQRDALEGEERMNALIEERCRLEAEYIRLGRDSTEAGLDAREKMLKLDREIEVEGKRQQQEKERRQSAIADARADEARERLDQQRKEMTVPERVKSMEKERKALMAEAEGLEGTDPEKAARKRIEALKLEAAAKDELKGESERIGQEQIDRKRSAAANITVDSLQAVGGGGNAAAVGSDPSLREQQQQTQMQREILQLLRQLNPGNNRFDRKIIPPWQ